MKRVLGPLRSSRLGLEGDWGNGEAEALESTSMWRLDLEDRRRDAGLESTTHEAEDVHQAE